MKILVRTAITTAFAIALASSAWGADIFQAIDAGDLQQVVRMIEREPGLLDVKNGGQMTPLNHAARRGQTEIVRHLLSRGADPLVPNGYGRTPFHAAVMGGHAAVAELMVRAGVEPDSVPSNPFSPVTWAIRNGDRDMIGMLLTNGADIRRTTALGETYLHFATFFGNKDLVEYFIQAGIDVNVVKRGNMTPLHIAAVTGDHEIAAGLIEHGGDPNIRSTDGATPLHFARAARNDAIVALLLSKGADDVARTFPIYRGKYLGASPPGDDPEPFVPELFRDIYRVHSPPTFTSDGREVYWEAMFMMGVNSASRVWFMREEDGVWQAPRVAPFAEYPCGGPLLAHDDRSLIYHSLRPRTPHGELAADLDLWLVERRGADWSEPIHLDPPINLDGESEVFPYLAPDGTLYIRRNDRGYVQYGRVEGKYVELGVIGGCFQADYVDPCRAMEHVILMSDRRRGRFHYELFISFHLADGTWSRPVYMGDRLHQGARTDLGRVSPGGRHLFFVRDYSHYWVDAGIIEELRP